MSVACLVGEGVEGKGSRRQQGKKKFQGNLAPEAAPASFSLGCCFLGPSTVKLLPDVCRDHL